jgi:excinuclease ABC subunit A
MTARRPRSAPEADSASGLPAGRAPARKKPAEPRAPEAKGAAKGKGAAKSAPKAAAKAAKAPAKASARANPAAKPDSAPAAEEGRYLGRAAAESGWIRVRGARSHNLQGVDLDLPAKSLVVFTGVSGSGKSTLAFDTLYAEGQRRYVESLSAYARQFLQLMEKPDVDSIEGLSPAISIEQKATSHNPRSTVGTVTEIHDYLRLLFARCGDVHCPFHGHLLSAQSASQMAELTLAEMPGAKVMVLAPLARGRKGEFAELFRELASQGFAKARVDGQVVDIEPGMKLEKNAKHDIDAIVDRLTVSEEHRQRIAEGFEAAVARSGGQAVAAGLGGGSERLFSARFACPECGWSLPELEPRLFSFNSPMGACPGCDGLGQISFFDPARIAPDRSRSIADGAVLGWDKKNAFYHSMLLDVARHYGFSPNAPLSSLSERHLDVLFNGSGEEKIEFTGESRFSPAGKSRRHAFEGIARNYQRRMRETESAALREEWGRFVNVRACPDCQGARLRPEARAVSVGGRALHELSAEPIGSLQASVEGLRLSGHREEIAGKIRKEIAERLRFLNDVGLGYLTLSRSAETLSGGEAQRIRLASQIGSGLTGVMYVLDEPSIGLHQRDNDRLIRTMRRLRDLGNSVLVVEHDEDAIRSADFVVDVGPGAGRHGGRIVSAGTPEQVAADPASLTGAFLSGREKIEPPAERRQPDWSRALRLLGATGNNLKGVDLEIPAGLLTCVCGVSGSGKSTLVNDTLWRACARAIHGAHADPFPHRALEGAELFDKVVDVDQSPIGRTPRSNPATYTGLFTPIRELFAQTPMARERGYDAGRFSFNVKGGRCEACQGDGLITVEMHFLPDMHVPCETCQGQRYNSQTLEVLLKGRSISDVLRMTVEEAALFFSAQPAVARKLETLMAVGLGYIQLGQPATTLSGGEAQRVKLALELSRRDSGRTLYILDEPTTGLHFHDVRLLLGVLRELVDRGNTVVVIEHNLDVIKTADWLVDVGPEGGDGGGRIVAVGPPEAIAADPTSATGPYLAAHLPKIAAAPPAEAPQAPRGGKGSRKGC